ncbi:secretin N-terminal domain-containing protein [Chamaesiphon sp. VAR_69_metabat_338]|uniref:secretin N-terminal domain-containing protein n=1 Tax=Chamaesiphon sp. VAR_69_metabat_338 TaxID=2964704 RepID=UPI00286EAC2C|nr:secretin N-terminal domain-containing protein [Chamaesiphon sp. VAR_69_metabat_338]
MSKRKQIITSMAIGSAVAALSAAHVNAATRTQIDAPAPSSNLVAQTPPAPPAPSQQPLVPNPKITIDGVNATPGVGLQTPTMPRAVAPPIGDISVSTMDAAMPQINLDSKKLYSVTATQSARELLRQIAFEANLNVVDSDSSDSKATPDKSVSVRFRNEPIQNVFNYVLQLSGLEANRIGNTIFVGAKLPDSVKETIVRTVRLNQVSSTAAANFLATQGAESQIALNTTTYNSVGTDIAQAAGSTVSGSALSKVVETRSSSIQTLKATTENGPLVLKGLSVSADDRLNSVTLVGTARKVEMATALLTRLDARRRQVALNVKVVDIALNNNASLGTNFNFQSGNTSFSSNGGNATLNFGGSALNPTQIFASVQASIANKNGKILTDPTLVVQEGQRSTVNLTQEVVAGLTTTISNTTPPITTQTYLIKNAGIILDLLVNRIDDNGFVSVTVSPTVSSIGDTYGSSANGNLISLLRSRTLNSGEIRLRDGQTLILSGIIQESDQSTVTKVPVLGDIPLLGILFRSTSKAKIRQEVVVLVTPQILNDNKGQATYTPGVDARLMMGK